MNQDDAEEWTQSLAQVGAGWWRQVALAVKQGVPAALGVPLDEWREQRLGGLVLKSIPERREATAELRAEGMTQREIAGVLGVDAATVNRDLKASVADATAAPADEADDEVAASLLTNPVASATAIEPRSNASAQMEALPVAAAAESGPSTQLNEGDEWYTPRWLFDALGIKFSVDVCAPLDRTFSSVPADGHMTIEDDGLSQPWQGTVWCNPPYSKPEPWARRMIHHGDGLLLTHIPMNAGWCVDLWETCDAIRLFQAMEFVRPDGTSQRPGYWLQLAAFGPVATEALGRLQPLGAAAANKRRVASPMWRRAA